MVKATVVLCGVRREGKVRAKWRERACPLLLRTFPLLASRLGPKPCNQPSITSSMTTLHEKAPRRGAYAHIRFKRACYFIFLHLTACALVVQLMCGMRLDGQWY